MGPICMGQRPHKSAVRCGGADEATGVGSDGEGDGDSDAIGDGDGGSNGGLGALVHSKTRPSAGPWPSQCASSAAQSHEPILPPLPPLPPQKPASRSVYLRA